MPNAGFAIRSMNSDARVKRLPMACQSWIDVDVKISITVICLRDQLWDSRIKPRVTDRDRRLWVIQMHHLRYALNLPCRGPNRKSLILQLKFFVKEHGETGFAESFA